MRCLTIYFASCDAPSSVQRFNKISKMERHATIRHLVIWKFSEVPGDFGSRSGLPTWVCVSVSHFPLLNAIASVLCCALVIGCLECGFSLVRMLLAMTVRHPIVYCCSLRTFATLYSWRCSLVAVVEWKLQFPIIKTEFILLHILARILDSPSVVL